MIKPVVALTLLSASVLAANAQTISTATTSAVALTAAETLTVTATGSITTSGVAAVDVNGASVAVAIDNTGVLSSDNDGGTINLTAVGADLSGTITNAGTLTNLGSGSDSNALRVDGQHRLVGFTNAAGGIISVTGNRSTVFMRGSSNSELVTINGDISNAGAIGTLTGGGQASVYLKRALIGGSILNSGTISGLGDAIELDGQVTLVGSLINSGTVQIDNDTGLDIRTASTIRGNLENTATGVIEGSANSNGIVVSSAFVEGDLINRGSITSGSDAIVIAGSNSLISGDLLNTGDAVSQIYGSGLDVSGSIGGDLVNSGTIQGSGGGQAGVSLYSSSSVGGDLNNSGTIEGAERDDGTGGSGLYLYSASIAGQIINGTGGSILSNNDADAALWIYRDFGTSTVGGIVNSGTIAGQVGAISGGSGGGILIEGADIVGDIVNEVSGVIRSDGGDSTDDGIKLGEDGSGGAIVRGSLINRGQIVAGVGTSEVDNQSGIEVSQAEVVGSITNLGSITSNGDNGIAIWGNNTAGVTGIVGGGIINFGTIQGRQEGLDLDDGATINGGIANRAGAVIRGLNADAVEIDEDTLVNGGLVNAGLIESTGASAIELDGTAILNGGLTNSGTILSSGDDGIEIIAGATLNGGLTNSGTIRSTDSDAIEIEDGGRLLGGLVNSSTGVIDATSGDALFLDDDGDEGELRGGVVNHGLIQASDDAIVFDDGIVTGGIQNFGTILAGNQAFEADAGANFSGVVSNEAGAVIAGQTQLDGSNNTAIAVVNRGTWVLMEDAALGRERNTGSIVTGNIIGGDFSNASGGELVLGVDDDSTYSTLEVGGMLDFAEGSAVYVNVQNGGANLADGDALVDVVSGASAATFGSVSVADNALGWKFELVEQADGFDLNARSTGFDTVVGGLAQGGTPLVQGAGGALDAVIADSDNLAIAATFGEQNSASALASLAAQTLPLLNTGTDQAARAVLAGAAKVVQARAESSVGLSAGDAVNHDAYAWVEPVAARSTQDAINGVSGYDATSTGFVLGIDQLTDSAWRMGAGFGVSHSQVDGRGSSTHHADLDTTQVFFYGAGDVAPAIMGNFQLTFASGDVHGRRQLPSFGVVAQSDYSTDSVTARAGLSHLMTLTPARSVTWLAGVEYAQLNSGGYTETGAGALNLSVQADRADSLIMSGGARLTEQLPSGSVIKASLVLGYDAKKSQESLTAAYQGGGSLFTTDGLDQDPWSAEFGLSLARQITPASQLSFNYQASLAQAFLGQSASLKYRWSF